MTTHGYLTAGGVEASLRFLARNYPSICDLIELPQPSAAGRLCRALRIGAGGGPERHGVLFVGGVEPPDVTPDLLVYFSLSVCQSYAARSGCAFGARLYEPAVVRGVVENLDIFVLPLLNPDAYRLDRGLLRGRARQHGRGNARHLLEAYPHIRSTYTVEPRSRPLSSHVEALYIIDHVSAELLEYCIACLSESEHCPAPSA